jgi:ABC-type polysaccharide/polyol phosphate transport system ATPase subunit
VKPGAIVADDLSRRFRVFRQRNVTLKEAIVRRRELRPVDIWALRGVSFEVEPGQGIGFIGRNGSGKTTLLRLIAGIFAPSSGRIAVGGSVGSLLELGAGFHLDFTGRENIFLSGAIYGIKRNTLRTRLDDIVAFAELERFIDLPVRTYSAGMYMRLGFAIAVHIDADILLIDEVWSVGDEAYQRKCVDRILDFKHQGGTIAFVSHARTAVERLCERALLLRRGEVEFDGEAHEALRRYQAQLAREEAPEEREAGLHEWGTGDARVTHVSLESPDGRVRTEFAPDEPLVLRLAIASERPLPPPTLSVELRDSAGSLLGVHEQPAAEVGWEGEPGERTVRFEIEQLPVIDGRFQLGVSIRDTHNDEQYHRIERAAEFVVTPGDGARGWFRFEGRFVPEEAEVEVR